MNRALLARLDATEDRARLTALRGFPTVARAHVRSVGSEWLRLYPGPGPVLARPLVSSTWAAGPVAAVVGVAGRARAVGEHLERAVPPPPELQATVLTAAALPIRQDDADAAAELAESQVRPAIERAAGDFDQSMITALVDLTVRAAREGWTVSRYVGAVERAARLMGAGGAAFQTSWIASWYRTLLTSAWAQGLADRLREEPTDRLWPYLEYVPRSDDRVRPNHAHLRGFAAPPGWFGWPRVRPANGYNCRCRLVPVSWQEARRRGWSTLFPGRSAEILASWSGPDPDFLKAA